MCGIAGILAREGAPPSRAEVDSMVEQLRHRGPDDADAYVDAAVALGSARLSIIDIEGGRQPLSNEDHSIRVVFNGEVFNYLELQSELAACGHVFRTHSDTEAIVHAYEQYGLDFVQHLNGQFAVALWDSRSRRLVLARDRIGERPLFYTSDRGRLLFASEIKALFALSSVPRRLDRFGLAETMMFWAPQGAQTLFEGIKSLQPGHIMVIEGSGELREQRYWDWAFAPQPVEARNFDAAIEELRFLLEDSVRLRLRADVAVGAYLSGGLDSSITTALARQLSPAPLRTFSIRFEDQELDEGAYQTELVRHLGTDHTSFVCSALDIGRTFPRVIWHAETALVRTAPTPLMLLSETVRDHGFKVVLTGEGADEVFGGYDLFRESIVRRYFARHPGSRLAMLLLTRLYPHLKLNPAAVPAFAKAFFCQGLGHLDDSMSAHRLRWQTTQRSWQMFSRDFRASLAQWDPIETLRKNLSPQLATWEPLCRDQYVEAHTLLSSYLLSSQGDRMAMANSVETRMPFLDHRVVEFANRLAPSWKVLGLREKHILKRALGHLIPASIVRRPKQPYRAPDSRSFFAGGRPLHYVARLLSRRRLGETGVFDATAAQRLLHKCSEGRALGFADNMAFVGMLSTMLLDEIMVRGQLDEVITATAS